MANLPENSLWANGCIYISSVASCAYAGQPIFRLSSYSDGRFLIAGGRE